MEQLSTPLVSSSESDNGGPLGGGTSSARNHVVKPVIPPKPEGYETLGRRHHKSSENGSAVSLSEHRLSYTSTRPKSGEALNDLHPSASSGSLPGNSATNSSAAAAATAASRQSPRSPRSKAPAPPVPSTSPRPPPLFSLADGQDRVGLALDAPCPLGSLLTTAPVQGSGGGAGGAPSCGVGVGGGGSAAGKHQSAGFEPGQLSAWNNPLIEPPQLFQSPMDLDLTFDAELADHQHASDYSHQVKQQTEPMRPVKVNEPPRLPSVPPVATSLSISLSSMDPLSKQQQQQKQAPLPNPSELNKMYKSETNGQRIEPRVTTDLVKLDRIDNNKVDNRAEKVERADKLDKVSDAEKPSRVLPLKPFSEAGQKSAGQSLESIQSNTSTIDTTDSPHSANERSDHQQQPPQHQQQQQRVEPVQPVTDATAGAKTAPLLLPAPLPPAPIPPPSSYMTIDIDPAGPGTAAPDGSEKPLEPFYPPNSFRPYSFHSECWRKEIPENETKWEMYKRRFCEFVFNFVACCIRCIGPV